MTRGGASVTAVLDEGFDVATRIAAPWMGVLWLTGLPYRLLQVHLAHRLLVLSGEASQHGVYIRQLAVGLVAAFVVAVVGRTVFARACTEGLRSRRAAGWGAIVPRAADLAGHLLVASALLAVGSLLAVTIVVVPIVAALLYLAAAACQDLPGVSIRTPFASLSRALSLGLVPLALVLVFCLAILIAGVNLYFAGQVGLWLAGGLAGVDLATWHHLLSYRTPAFLMLVGAGAVLLVEPFWIATSCVVVHVARSRQSGDDLRNWFSRLTREEAA